MSPPSTRKKRQPYAVDTKCSVTKTRRDIEDLLERYGASSFMGGWEDSRYGIMFKFGVHQFVFYLHTNSNERANRSRWRALYLVVKAKLVAVDSGIATFEEEFLSWVMTKNRTPLGNAILPMLEGIAAHGVPALLPEPPESQNEV